MRLTFKDKVVLITGGSSGIGKALAAEAMAEGARVAVCARNLAALKEMQQQYDRERFFIYQADVSREEDCRNFVNAAEQHFHKIDVLINNAGLSMRALFGDLQDLSVVKTLMDVNFWGTVYCTFYAMPALLRSKGTVAAISSVAGYRGLPGRTAYSSSKFAIQGFLEALRTENLHTGVHVMWVCPGFTSSNIRNTALDKSGRAQAESPLEESRLMTAEKVAKATLAAIARRKRSLVFTSQGKLTVWLNKLFPSLMDRLVYDHFKKEPGSPLP